MHARHILVATEDEAKAIVAELKKGADFADAGQGEVEGPGRAAEGGDLGYFAKEQMVPEFAEVAFKMDPGQVSDPVKTQFGWHIIKVEDKRTKPVPDFDKVKRPDRDLRRAQGAGRLRGQAAPDRQDRAAGQAAESKPEPSRTPSLRPRRRRPPTRRRNKPVRIRLLVPMTRLSPASASSDVAPS